MKTRNQILADHKAKLAQAIHAAAQQVRLVTAKGALTASDVVAAVKAHGLNLPSDVKRYITELAILIDSQWGGIPIKPADALSLAARLDNAAALI